MGGCTVLTGCVLECTHTCNLYSTDLLVLYCIPVCIVRRVPLLVGIEGVHVLPEVRVGDARPRDRLHRTAEQRPARRRDHPWVVARSYVSTTRALLPLHVFTSMIFVWPRLFATNEFLGLV